MRTWSNWMAALGILAFAAPALAAEPDRVVVRNRLYNPEGQIELGAQLGTTLVNRLVQHFNFQGTAAYSFTNELAIESFAGYAVSNHTDVADQVVNEIARTSVKQEPAINDFADLWQMRWNLAAGLRWAPIYGKLSLTSELPVHFQAYLGVGGGVAGLGRKSVAYCLAPTTTDTSGTPTCESPLEESRVSPVAEFGGGLRFFVGPKAALKLEVRDWTFPDKYQVNIDRASASSGNRQAGQTAGSPGLEHLVFFTAGVSYVF